MTKPTWNNATSQAAIIGFANALVQLVAAFGVTLTGTQNAAITAVMNSFLVVLSVLWGSNSPPAPSTKA